MIAATLNSNVWVVALAGAISFGVPLTLAALGEILAERSGVLNLGVEGMMLIGAVCAFLAGDQFHSPWLALAAGILAGGALSLVHAFLSVTLRANQIVSGLALVIFGTGLATYIGQSVEGKPRGTQVQPMEVPGLSDIPIIGRVLFEQDVLVYATFAATAIVAFYLFKTRTGLALRSVGESPATADAVGLSVSSHPIHARVTRRAVRGCGRCVSDARAGAVVEPGPYHERHRLDRARTRRVRRVASGPGAAGRDHLRLRPACQLHVAGGRDHGGARRAALDAAVRAHDPDADRALDLLPAPACRRAGGARAPRSCATSVSARGRW